MTDPGGADRERYRRHAEEVAERWERSRYGEEVRRSLAGVAPSSWLVAGRPPPSSGPAPDRPDVWPLLAVAPTATGTTDVRHHPAVELRLARGAEDHEQAAVVLSTVLDADLDLVRRVLGPNVAHVDGVSRLVAWRGHQVVGTVTLALTEDAGELVAGLHALAVAPRWRGRGTGLALVARAVELAVGAGATVVYAEAVPDGEEMLARLGFRRL